jgi:glycosyltransferase involved in cell wall biosynthesis
MDQAKLIQTLLSELNANKHAVVSLEVERNAIAQALRETRVDEEQDRRSLEFLAENVEDLAATLDWMTRLLKTLREEQEQVERELRPRLSRLLNDLAPPLVALPTVSPVGRMWSVCKRLARLVVRSVRVLKTEGPSAFLVKATGRVYRKLANRGGSQAIGLSLASQPRIFRSAEGGMEPEYTEWITRNEPVAADLIQQHRTVFPYQPRISVVVPTYNTPIPYLLAMIESVRAQTYPYWELCVADGGSHNQCCKRMLDYYARNDSRIKVIFLSENRGIAKNSNQAMALATGDYLALLDHDDTLSPFALFEIVAALNQFPDADFLYSDEDKITEQGSQRFCPHFKPAWAPDTLRSINYITHLSVFARTLLDKVGWFRSDFDGSQDYDLILRASEQADRILHIPKVLYHWRSHPQSVASSIEAKMFAVEAAERALREHLARCRLDARVQRSNPLGWYRVLHRLPRRPLVSIVIPNRDHTEVLRRCLDSISDSTYTNYEIVIIDNNSREPNTLVYYSELEKRPEVRVVLWDKPFNYAAVTNFGVRQSRGEMLLLLNNDVEVINRDWLECLLEHALRAEVGAVGAKLYYPNGAIQHAGVTVGFGVIAGHCGRLLGGHSWGPMGLLDRAQNLSAVTGACLMARRTVYEEVGGLDERFVLDFNDIDFCLKLRQCGYVNVWTPYAKLYHYESLTRGSEDTPEKQDRFQSEVRLFTQKWSGVLEAGDPYYNPNLALNSHCHDWSIRTGRAGSQRPRTEALQFSRTAAA